MPVRSSGLALTMRLSTYPFLLNTPQPIQRKVRPRAEAEDAALVRSVKTPPENRLILPVIAPRTGNHTVVFRHLINRGLLGNKACGACDVAMI